ncbi:hypothetical protein ACQCN2_03595 [Brevibacillus ginsengisoli]|uniref:hypothetical protein n=1 Tax=Brevibacillus ginsengisoli TaxID=363854 RepID=UPI003CF0E8E3
MIKKFLFFCFYSFVITSVLGCSSLDKSGLERFRSAFMNSDIIKPYLSGDIEIVDTGTSNMKEYTFHYFTVVVNANSKFEELSKDDKYYALLSGIKILKKESNSLGGGDFFCGEKQICSFKGVSFKNGNNTYSMLNFDSTRTNDYVYEMEIPNEEPYRPSAEQLRLDESVKKILSESDSKTKSDSYSVEPSEDNKAFAWTASIEAVKDKLKTPSTADFPFSYLNEDIKEVGINTFVVKSYVDAENSFGAKIRSNFTVKIKKTGDNSYTVEDISIN